MSRMICVSEYLIDGFGSEEPLDHPTSTGCWDDEGHRRVNGFLSNMGSSIAGLLSPHVFLTDLGLRLVALAARRNASNNLRWRGCRSKRNSGCHWMPRKKRWFGDSIASTIPSGARALAINDGATALTD